MTMFYFCWGYKICWLLVSNALDWCQWTRPLLSSLFIICPKMSKNEVIPSTRIPISHLARRCQCSICITISFCRIVTNVTAICWNQHGKSGRIWESMSMERCFAERFIIQQWLQWHPPLPQVWSHDPSGTWWRSGRVSRRWRRSVVEWLEMQIHLQVRTLSIGLCTVFLVDELGESAAEIIDLFCSFDLLPWWLWWLGGR